jgi:hypothetical protein
MNMQNLFVAPRVLDNSGFGKVEHLLLNILFYESIPSLILIFNGIKFIRVKAIDIFDVSDPVVDDSDRTVIHRRLHTSTAVVTTNYNVTYFKCVNGEIEATKKIKVCINDHIGDVSVDENFTRLCTNDYICGHSAVRATNPKNRWSLSLSLFDKVLRVNRQLRLNPFLVVLQEFLVKPFLTSFRELMSSLILRWLNIFFRGMSWVLDLFV